MQPAKRPRWPTAPRRSSLPPPATTCASLCTPWASSSPKPCAQRTHDPEEVSAAGGQHQRLGGCAREGLFSRAARHHQDRHRWRRRRRPSISTWARSSASCALHFNPGGLRSGPERCAFVVVRHVATCYADPVLFERILRNLRLERHPLHQRRQRAGELPAPRRAPPAAGLGHRPGHPRRGARPHLRGVLPGAWRPRRSRSQQRKKAWPSAWRSSSGCARLMACAARACAWRKAAARSSRSTLPRGQGAAHDDALDPGQGADRHHPRRPPDRHRRGRGRRCAKAWRCCSRPGAPP